MPTKTNKANNKTNKVQQQHQQPLQKAAASSKVKLQLSVDEKIKKTSKFIALKNDTTVSALFEDYIKAIDKNPKLIQLINEVTTK